MVNIQISPLDIPVQVIFTFHFFTFSVVCYRKTSRLIFFCVFWSFVGLQDISSQCLRCEDFRHFPLGFIVGLLLPQGFVRGLTDCFLYIVWPSVLSLMKIHQTKAVKNICIQEKFIIWSIFNLGLVSTRFLTIRPCLQQVNLTWADRKPAVEQWSSLKNIWPRWNEPAI